MEHSAAILEKLGERCARHAELTELLASSDLDRRKLPGLLRERGMLAKAVELQERWTELARREEQTRALLAESAADREMAALAKEELAAVAAEREPLYRAIQDALISDPDLERRKVIVEVRAGTGGDEAALFAADLFRTYQRFAEARGWKVEVLEASASDLGGFKEIVFAVDGEGAWRLLRFESGGHRVQRVPKTEAQGRIHTSAATVAVLAEAEEVDVELRPDDLEIETMRAGGAGGQHVNKTESAVRIRHVPTGLTVVCMDERSQHKNKARAMRILRSRLFDAEQQRTHNERAAQRKGLIGSGDRSERVRTYNFAQNRVSDHRLGENYSLEQVMEGKLLPMLEQLENRDREERIRAL